MEYTLDELFDLQMGKTPSRDNPDYWNSKDYKWISISDLTKCDKYIEETKEYLSEKAVSESGISLIPAETVVMSFKLSIGKTAITKEPMYSNEAIMSFRDRHIVDLIPDYIYYMFSSRNWDDGTNKAVMGKTLNKATLSKIKIQIHDYETQKYIVNVLDSISNLIDYRKQQLQALDDLVKARFVEMFGRCTQRKRLEDYTVLITKGASPKWQGVDYSDEGTLFVTSENVREGYVDLSKRKYLPNTINEIQPRSVLHRNDVLINIVGASIGRAAIFDSDELANTNQAVALVRLRENTIRMQFLITFLNSQEAQRSYGFMKKGGARDNLSLKNIADLLIPVATIAEQDKFADFVSQVDKSKVAVQKALEETQKLFDSLMQEYFG